MNLHFVSLCTTIIDEYSFGHLYSVPSKWTDTTTHAFIIAYISAMGRVLEEALVEY
jgi:hypothetical protein